MLRAALLLSAILLPAGCAAADSPGGRTPPEAVTARGQVEYWDLPTGSHIAYRHVAAPPARGLPPLVLLHGGPGAYQVARFDDFPDWWQQLASLGYDVYAYDQVGSGLSARLDDPKQYTVARHVADLEAIRVRLGVEQLALLGDSWGATLGSHYIAAHPERVERVIFTSPGAIDGREWNPTLAHPEFSPDMLEWIRTHRSRSEYQRCLAVDSLLQRDARAAHARYGDAEMDPLMDAWITGAILPHAVHDPASARDERLTGMGWWAQTMTAFDALSAAPAVRERLRSFTRPVLILHGSSDYLPPGMSRQYAETYPNARLVEIPRAGHLIWLEQPEMYGREILAFLGR